jgi:hypothetical protein
MIFSVMVTGVLNTDRAFSAQFMVPAENGEDAAKKLESELDWSDAKMLHMAADPADEQDITPAARLGIVRM